MSLYAQLRRAMLTRPVTARKVSLSLETLDHRVLPSHTPFAIPGAHPQPQDNNPFVTFKDRAYFAGGNAAGTDVELWKTDGKTASRVADINVGAGSSNPANLTVVDDTLYFTADNGTSGTELYKYDGKAVSLVADINPGPGSSSPYELTAVGKTLYFAADNGTTGREVYRTNGTPTGTVQLTDITPGSGDSAPYDLTALGNAVYFGASADGGSTFLLYKTAGVPGDAAAVSGSPTNPYDLTVLKNALYFGGTDAAVGQELFKTSGGAATLVKDINAGPGSSGPYELTVFKDALYFGASDGLNGTELWKSDGTAGGTNIVANINPGAADSNPYELTVFKDALYFFAADATGPGNNKLWKLKDGNVASLGSVSDNAFNLTAVGDSLYFTADGSNTNPQVFRTDGKQAPTQITSYAGTDVDFLSRFKNKLVYMTDDGTATELWVAKK